MDPVEPWIDREAVWRLAKQLSQPLPPQLPAVDVPFGDAFEGFAEATGEPLRGAAGLRQWAIDRFQAAAVFVLTRAGDPILADESRPELHRLAWSLACSRRALAGASPSQHVRIAEDAVLEVIPRDNALGDVVLGLVLPGALDPDEVVEVLERLDEVLESGGLAATVTHPKDRDG